MAKFASRPKPLKFSPALRTKLIAHAKKTLLTNETLEQLKKLPVGQRLTLAAGIARLVTRAVPTGVLVLAVPVAELRQIPNYPYPQIGEDGTPTGPPVTQDVVALIWQTVQFGVRFHFLYRPLGFQHWIKPPFVAENARLGMAAIVFPAGEYEFLPYPET